MIMNTIASKNENIKKLLKKSVLLLNNQNQITSVVLSRYGQWSANVVNQDISGVKAQPRNCSFDEK